MNTLIILFQIVVALGLLNVWLIRSSKKTEYRGSNSSSLKNEFAAYGLPVWAFYVVGFLKISSAIALLIGIWEPVLVFPAALIISFLMLGAVLMHLKVKDPFKKFLPALTMLFLSICIALSRVNQGIWS